MIDPARSLGPRQYVIQGRTVCMPCVVRDASIASATWLVGSKAAQALLPGSQLEVAEVAPGRGLLTIACIDYRDNDLGDYNEVSLAVFVRARGERHVIPYFGSVMDMVRGRLATHILHLPVDQSFTCEAGRKIWGFPKTVDDIDFDHGGDRARCVWNKDGHTVLKLSLPRGGHGKLPEQTLRTYSYLDGTLHETRFTSSAEDFGIRLAGAQIELGAHPIADELRSLGLPKSALMSMWMGKMRGRFEAPQPS